MFKKTLAGIALIAITGCAASMDVDPNHTRTSSDTSSTNNRDTAVTYNSDRNGSASVNTNSDRYDRTYDAQTAADRSNPDYRSSSSSSSYHSTYRAGSSAYNDQDSRSDDGPIMTDPIGRPERVGPQVQRDLQAAASGSKSSSNSGGVTASARMDAGNNNSY